MRDRAEAEQFQPYKADLCEHDGCSEVEHATAILRDRSKKEQLARWPRFVGVVDSAPIGEAAAHEVDGVNRAVGLACA